MPRKAPAFRQACRPVLAQPSFDVAGLFYPTVASLLLPGRKPQHNPKGVNPFSSCMYLILPRPSYLSHPILVGFDLSEVILCRRAIRTFSLLKYVCTCWLIDCVKCDSGEVTFPVCQFTTAGLPKTFTPPSPETTWRIVVPSDTLEKSYFRTHQQTFEHVLVGISMGDCWVVATNMYHDDLQYSCLIFPPHSLQFSDLSSFRSTPQNPTK